MCLWNRIKEERKSDCKESSMMIDDEGDYACVNVYFGDALLFWGRGGREEMRLGSGIPLLCCDCSCSGASCMVSACDWIGFGCTRLKARLPLEGRFAPTRCRADCHLKERAGKGNQQREREGERERERERESVRGT